MKKDSGFTLIELMIVVAVIGILAAIAIPNYNEYVIRSKITEGLSGLSQMATKLEQYFQDNRSYVGACPAFGSAAVSARPKDTTNFTYTCPTLSATTYVVLATGTGSMNGFVYSLEPNNVKKTTGVPSGWTIAATCWTLNKGGGC
jgi:type IV pilus assembly protein PilE